MISVRDVVGGHGGGGCAGGGMRTAAVSGVLGIQSTRRSQPVSRSLTHSLHARAGAGHAAELMRVRVQGGAVHRSAHRRTNEEKRREQESNGWQRNCEFELPWAAALILASVALDPLAEQSKKKGVEMVEGRKTRYGY